MKQYHQPYNSDGLLRCMGQSYVKNEYWSQFSYIDYLLYNLMPDYILTSIKIYNIIYWSLLQSIRPVQCTGLKSSFKNVIMLNLLRKHVNDNLLSVI